MHPPASATVLLYQINENLVKAWHQVDVQVPLHRLNRLFEPFSLFKLHTPSPNQFLIHIFCWKCPKKWGPSSTKIPPPGFLTPGTCGGGGPCQQLRRGISEAAAAAGAALADSDVSVSNAALQANLVNPCKDQQSLYAILLCLHAAPLLVCATHMICWQHWYFANSGASENVPPWRQSA